MDTLTLSEISRMLRISDHTARNRLCMGMPMPPSFRVGNLRSAVSRSRREPLINRTYGDMARHYNLVVLPARAKKPKDKPKVEGGVLIAQRLILAPLRNMTFFSLAGLNQEIARLVDVVNNRPFKKIPGCRRSRFEDLERAHMQALPAARYEFAEWSAPQTVPLDYHVVADRHWYSVPHHLVRQKVETRLTASTVEIYQTGSRIASHPRSHVEGGTPRTPVTSRRTTVPTQSGHPRNSRYGHKPWELVLRASSPAADSNRPDADLHPFKILPPYPTLKSAA